MNYSFSMRHVLEIKFYNKQFAFIDQLGTTTERLTKELGLGKVRIIGSRIDLASDSLDKLFFFTIENIGLQLESQPDFTQLKESSIDLKKLVDNGFVDINSVARIGVRSTILSHATGKSFEATKQLLSNTLLSSIPSFNESAKIKSTDIGYIAQDAELGSYKLHSQIGPVKLEEAIARFFNGQAEHYRAFGKDGLISDFDVFSDKVDRQPDVDKLFNQINEQIDMLDKLHQTLLNYVFVGKDG